MAVILDIQLITSFLEIVRREIDKGNRVFIDFRYIDSNGKRVSAKQGLIDIGITKSKLIWDYIKALTPQECFRVSRDYDVKRDMNSEMFEFMKRINNKDVYIKLTLNDKGVVCLSFHISNK